MSSFSLRSTSLSDSPRRRVMGFLPRKASTNANVNEDSDDENILGPPQLSDFGSALLSDKENVEPSSHTGHQKYLSIKRLRTSKESPKTLLGLEPTDVQRNAPSNNTYSGTSAPYSTSQYNEDPSDYTMFAHSKDHQQSMTTFESAPQPDISKSYFPGAEKGRAKINNLQQALKDELLTRSSRRRNRRFISSRLSALGPAKRASSTAVTPSKSELVDDSNVSQQEMNLSNSSSVTGSANKNMGRNYNVFYEPTQGNPPSTNQIGSAGLVEGNYDDIEFGDLNPYQYLKRHNLPTTELPNISRVYFERQKGENRRAALRKNTLTKDTIQSRLASASLSNSPLVQHTEAGKGDLISAKREPRRKISDSSTKNVLKALSSPAKGLTNVNKDSHSGLNRHEHESKYEHIEIPDSSYHGYIKRREALSNIDLNSNRSYQSQHKKLKYAEDRGTSKDELYQQPQYHHREYPNSEANVPVYPNSQVSTVKKHVEIVEPAKVLSNASRTSPPLETDHVYKKRAVVSVNGNDYEKLELLGRGGTSKVYKVKNSANKVYALKRVSFDEFDDNSIDSFKGEIELLKKLETKPRVVKLIDYEMSQGVLYVVMECGDHDLSHTLAQRSNMDFDVEFVRYHAQEMFKCVKVVHDAGIVHSDLKPANFVFVKGILKIIDFGIANAVPEHTVNIYRETQIGTPNYMAPEALVAMNFTHDRSVEQNRWKVGKPSDIWSCGCIIYQMIYGRPPYGGFQGQNRLLAIMNPDVKIIYPEKTPNGDIVPKTVIDTMKACLERDPDKRWTVDEALNGPFVRPIAVTHFFVRDLIRNSVKYGFNQRELSNDKIEELADDVWHRLAEFRL
ncbi:LADA_0E05996g1_1 [Lachancea dasiensis]|uniref:LADA_0E05996g1_1 n=1 Tax=Lachancea dasiensis TaxID=1072105 RepID=A0A1G4JC99_9SACH|nr:LADA_0E05996g1_1 [Lachancea dasiensis]